MTRDRLFKIGVIGIIGLILVLLHLNNRSNSSWIAKRRTPRNIIGALRPASLSGDNSSPLSYQVNYDYDRLVRNAAFGLKPKTDPPLVIPPPTKAAPPPTAPPLEDLDLRLNGTMVGSTTHYAFIFDEKSKQQDFYSIGDQIHQATIVAIRRNEVDLERFGARKTIRIDLSGKKAPKSIATTRPLPRNRPRQPQRVSRAVPSSKGGRSTIQISKAEINRNLANLQRLSREVRVQPYFQRGKLTGFLLSNVRRNSFIERMGGRNGDVVKSIDGKPIDSVQKAFSLYNTFRNKRDLNLTVLRGGRPHTISYKVR